MSRCILKVLFWIFTLNLGPSILNEFRSGCEAAEDDYNRRYTNQQYVIWHEARQLHACNKIALENLCMKAHRKAGYQRSIKHEELHSLRLKQELLQFKKNWTYNPVRVDVLSYWYKEKKFYLTLGLTPDCVFYLKPSKIFPGRFRLGNKYICGVVDEDSRSDTNTKTIRIRKKCTFKKIKVSKTRK